MVRMKVTLLTLIVFHLISSLPADEPAPKRRYREYSPNRQFFIEMIPQAGTYDPNAGEGIAYSANSGHMLWKVNWFAQEVVLSDDGIHLIRFGPWASQQRGLSELAVAFYANGNELKRYTVKDLIKDKSRLEYSISFYTWQAVKSSVKQGLSKNGKKFTLVMIDGSVYTFSVSSGKVISQSKDPKAEGHRALKTQ